MDDIIANISSELRCWKALIVYETRTAMCRQLYVSVTVVNVSNFIE